MVAVRLLRGKLTLVHRDLWPALFRLADRVPAESLAAVYEEHTERGTHRTTDVSLLDWVPEDVRRAAAGLTAAEALDRLPPGVQDFLRSAPDKEPAVLRLSHIHLTVSDLAASTAWYRDTLGVSPGYEDDSMVEFYDLGLILDGPAAGRPAGAVIVGFEVDDVDAVFTALRDRGAALDEPPTDRPWGVRSFYLRDPDGYQLEFEQRTAEGVP